MKWLHQFSGTNSFIKYLIIVQCTWNVSPKIVMECIQVMSILWLKETSFPTSSLIRNRAMSQFKFKRSWTSLKFKDLNCYMIGWVKPVISDKYKYCYMIGWVKPVISDKYKYCYMMGWVKLVISDKYKYCYMMGWVKPNILIWNDCLLT